MLKAETVPILKGRTVENGRKISLIIIFNLTSPSRPHFCFRHFYLSMKVGLTFIVNEYDLFYILKVSLDFCIKMKMINNKSL